MSQSVAPSQTFTDRFDEVCDLIMQEREGIVGICGLEGVGKTTILTQIKNQFLSLPPEVSCLVIWVSISKPLRLERILEIIGNQVGFDGEHWMSKSIDAKAEDIFSVLSKKMFVLLLDDLGEKIDFLKIGIPSQHMPNGSKIVFTTTSKNLCNQMVGYRFVELGLLSQKDAFEFFKERIGEDMINGNQTIFQLAKFVSGKCNFLPLALVSAAHTMSCKRSPQEWSHAVEVMKKFISMQLADRGVPGTGFYAVAVLKFGYSSLTCVARSCLLYCALFPAQFKILKEELIDYWICEELLDDDDNGGQYEEEHDGRARLQKLGFDVIDSLVNTYFLEEENQYVKMHSVVRGVALLIAKRTKEKFFVQAGDNLTEMPKVGISKGVRRISLMENSIRTVSEVPNCTDLKTLFLSYNPLTMISGNLFLFMNRLQVLDLSHSSMEELPPGVSNLASLQYLNLSYTCLEKLPYEIRMLSDLKYLNLEHNDLLRVIPAQVIPSLLSLQALKMFHCGFSLVEEDNILSDSNMLVNELKHLKHLNVLSITITLASALETLSSSHKLLSCIEALSLECLWGSKSFGISLLAAMKHLATLEIHRTDHLEEFNVDFRVNRADIQEVCYLHEPLILRKASFSSLKEVSVANCPHLRDLTWLILVPNLEVLRVTACGKIEEIISTGKLANIATEVENLFPFVKLKVFVLENLPEMRSIYWTALPFTLLNKIRVLNCPLLKKLPFNSSSGSGNRMIILAEDQWWEDIEWEDNAAKRIFSKRFISMPN